MYENIEVDRPNFCIGPQAGTCCSVDNEVDPVVMHVKNDSGTLIRTYTFYPQDILHIGPKSDSFYDILPNPNTYSYHDFVTIQYVGPYDQASYYDGAVFYTLERRAKGRRKYYTYDDPEDPYKTDYRVEYDSNIVRKWVLDNVNFRLELVKTIYYNSDETNWFDANAFAIQNVVTTFDWHTSTNTGVIELTTTSGLKKYDTLFLGPSTDTTNPGKVEEVYVHSVNGTAVEIKTYGGVMPTVWEYMQYDPITIHNNIFLFSNSRPLIDEQYIAYGYESREGTLYRTDQVNYGTVLEVSYSGIYSDVFCATWNNYYGMLSFVKGTNLLHLNVSDYEISRSQDIHLENPESQNPIQIYDIDIKDSSIYKLQYKILQHDDDGQYAEVLWDTYNYHSDTLLPYSNSVTLYVTDRVLLRQGQTIITAVVRDQFGVGLLSKNVWFTQSGDVAGELTPVSGYMVTDANGKASIQYDASSSYTGHHNIKVKVDGGSVSNGSSFVVASTMLQQYHNFTAPCSLRSVIIDDFTVSILSSSDILSCTSLQGKVAYTFPGNTLTNNDMSGWQNNINDTTSIIMTINYPTLKDHSSGDNKVKTNIRQSKSLLKEPEEGEEAYQSTCINSQELVTNTKQISSNYISRHLSYGHVDNVTIDQFVFVQDAVPAMWSEKNNVDTDYWIRLRPFAASLNPTSLVIKIKEKSYLGDSGWSDITDLGTITMFDAGGGLLGIDFLYNPIDIFHHNSIVHIDIEVYDSALIPNKIVLDYWFTIIQDYKAPYVENRYPTIGAFDVPLNPSIHFDLIDDGEGVDISTLEVFINQRIVDFTYDEYEPGNYHIYCNLLSKFNYGEEVTVGVDVCDRSDANNRLLCGWSFYCVESTGPWIDMDNTVPSLCMEGSSRKQPVAMQVYGINDTGIAYDSIKMEVGGRYRNIKITPIVYRLN